MPSNAFMLVLNCGKISLLFEIFLKIFIYQKTFLRNCPESLEEPFSEFTRAPRNTSRRRVVSARNLQPCGGGEFVPRHVSIFAVAVQKYLIFSSGIYYLFH